MSDFDPYYLWLGIPPQEQPPNHYRLLGVTRFEENSEVIDAAANRQASYLNTLSTGKNRQASQQLLNEVSAARRCLLSLESKAAYDQTLKAKSRSVAVPDKNSDPNSPDNPLGFLSKELVGAPSPPSKARTSEPPAKPQVAAPPKTPAVKSPILKEEAPQPANPRSLAVSFLRSLIGTVVLVGMFVFVYVTWLPKKPATNSAKTSTDDKSGAPKTSKSKGKSKLGDFPEKEFVEPPSVIKKK